MAAIMDSFGLFTCNDEFMLAEHLHGPSRNDFDTQEVAQRALLPRPGVVLASIHAGMRFNGRAAIRK
jgi:hypothetical protein